MLLAKRWKIPSTGGEAWRRDSAMLLGGVRGMDISTAIMENSLKVPKKLKIGLELRPIISVAGIYSNN